MRDYEGGLVKIKMLYPHEMDAYYTDVPGGSASVVVVSCAAGRFPALFEEPNQRLKLPNARNQAKIRSFGRTVVILSVSSSIGSVSLPLTPGRAIALAVSVVVVIILIGSI